MPINGQKQILVKLYNSPTLGSEIYSQQTDVTVINGHFSVSVDNLDHSKFSSDSVFLGITVDGTELLPRVEFKTVPYAFKSAALGDVAFVQDDALVVSGNTRILGTVTIPGYPDLKSALDGMVDGSGITVEATGVWDKNINTNDIMYVSGNVGVGVAPDSDMKLHVGGNGKFDGTVTIEGGADLAELFDSQSRETIKKGMVMVIDESNPGKLKPSRIPYDRKVVGVVSGANNLNTGMLMSQTGTMANGQYPIALIGRVWVLCTNENGDIKPGDFLTTSPKLGHAMKSTDYEKQQGATIGKAMTSLNQNSGFVLVLITLQ